MILAVIDDNDDFARLVRRVAEGMGWTVVAYRDGDGFIDAISGGQVPTLVMLDVLMRKRDGIEVISWMAEHAPHLPVVIVSGADPLYVRVMQELAAAGGVEIHDVLRKPVSVEDLRAMLSTPPGGTALSDA